MTFHSSLFYEEFMSMATKIDINMIAEVRQEAVQQALAAMQKVVIHLS